jgi:hypothetical protein
LFRGCDQTHRKHTAAPCCAATLRLSPSSEDVGVLNTRNTARPGADHNNTSPPHNTRTLLSRSEKSCDGRVPRASRRKIGQIMQTTFTSSGSVARVRTRAPYDLSHADEALSTLSRSAFRPQGRLSERRSFRAPFPATPSLASRDTSSVRPTLCTVPTLFCRHATPTAEQDRMAAPECRRRVRRGIGMGGNAPRVASSLCSQPLEAPTNSRTHLTRTWHGHAVGLLGAEISCSGHSLYSQ